MPGLERFGLKATALEEWVPWGGIVRPNIMKQKDNSLFAVIKYQPYTIDLNKINSKDIILWPFRRGWVLWSEHQHNEDADTNDFLVICWNSFYSKTSSYIGNTLDKKVEKKLIVDYFAAKAAKILADLRKYTQADFLEYQELMNFLSFSLSQGMNHPQMPDIPLYMDALLTDDIDIRFHANGIDINNQHLYLVSMLTPDKVTNIYSRLVHVTFRHSRRLVCFNKKEAEIDLNRYTRSWFPSRKVLRQAAITDIVSNYNGYYMDCFQFLLNDNDNVSFRNYFRAQLETIGYSFIEESYSLKEVFWGSIPGLFLANTRPPITGFHYLTDFLTGGDVKEKIIKKNILEDAKNNLIQTPIKVTDYIHVNNFGSTDGEQ